MRTKVKTITAAALFIVLLTTLLAAGVNAQDIIVIEPGSGEVGDIQLFRNAWNGGETTNGPYDSGIITSGPRPFQAKSSVGFPANKFCNVTLGPGGGYYGQAYVREYVYGVYNGEARSVVSSDEVWAACDRFIRKEVRYEHYGDVYATYGTGFPIYSYFYDLNHE